MTGKLSSRESQHAIGIVSTPPSSPHRRGIQSRSQRSLGCILDFSPEPVIGRARATYRRRRPLMSPRAIPQRLMAFLRVRAICHSIFTPLKGGGLTLR